MSFYIFLCLLPLFLVSLLHQLSSSNFVNAFSAIQNLQILFSSPAKFILMDAYIEDKYLDVLFSQFPNLKTQCGDFFVNTFQNKQNEEMEIILEPNTFITHFTISAKEGKTLCFASDTRKQCELFAEIYKSQNPGKNILLVHGKNSNTKASFLP